MSHAQCIDGAYEHEISHSEDKGAKKNEVRGRFAQTGSFWAKTLPAIKLCRLVLSVYEGAMAGVKAWVLFCIVCCVCLCAAARVAQTVLLISMCMSACASFCIKPHHCAPLRSAIWGTGAACVSIAAIAFTAAGFFVKLLPNVPDLQIIVCLVQSAFKTYAASSICLHDATWCAGLQILPVIGGMCYYI